MERSRPGRENEEDLEYQAKMTGLSKREIEMRKFMAQRFGREAAHLRRPDEESKANAVNNGTNRVGMPSAANQNPRSSGGRPSEADAQTFPISTLS